MQGPDVWKPPAGALGRLVSRAHERARRLEREHEAGSGAHEQPPPPVPSLADSLRRGARVAVVAELKRRSPSRGAINETLAAPAHARAYAAGGAAGLSVLTEPDEFGGSLEDLRLAREATALPVLRKDFLVHELQLAEARAAGASAVLLIARALHPSALARLRADARARGLEVLVEVRTLGELDAALALEPDMVGVNSRDLETLVVDTSATEQLVPRIPAHVVAIAESGIAAVADVERAALWGADAVLVGSSISAAADPAAAVRALASVARRRRGD